LFRLLCGLASVAVLAQAADRPAPAQRETVAKPLSERAKRLQEDRLRRELEAPFRRWLDEDVGYIITNEERTAFKRLSTAEEQESFIEQFWLRRDPTPDTAENEFKEEHYRRIAYTNERFASGIPGWKTDRGRIYITYGPADEIESRPSGGTYNRPYEEGGGTTSTYPFEIWRYRWIEGVGTDVLIEFVDPTMTGEYRMTMDPSEKDALLHVPNAGLTMMEEMGLADKADRFSRTDGTRLGVPQDQLVSRLQPFERLQQFANLQKPPVIKFKDLEAAVNSKITYNLLPMRVRVDYVRMTNSSVLTNVTLLFERGDLQFQAKEGVHRATVNIYGRITNMSRRPIQIFEDPVSIDVPAELLQEAVKGSSVYGKSFPLAPGIYRLNVVAKDVVGGNMNNYEVALNVPRYDDETLASSTMVLADVLEPVPTRNIGAGQFVIGTMKVRPRVGETFQADEKMGVYVQFYNFAPDEKTQKPNGSIQYEVIKEGNNEKVIDFTEDVSAIDGASANQVTVEKLLPLQTIGPGRYTLRLTAQDRNGDQKVATSSSFTVK
ncbi:MAG TPA: GWxTD domain-containing protein, partial [Bryobacteraceae bacterium]|nr:GWxTD domain-containing protein [Bryobacteraceae bacterium]